ncbi:MAG: hypothetical protein U9N09_05115 [Euryarchaeota archaeon]|nr:hypothetical protein [Euryarchaeota archaeon]
MKKLSPYPDLGCIAPPVSLNCLERLEIKNTSDVKSHGWTVRTRW